VRATAVAPAAADRDVATGLVVREQRPHRVVRPRDEVVRALVVEPQGRRHVRRLDAAGAAQRQRGPSRGGHVVEPVVRRGAFDGVRTMTSSSNCLRTGFENVAPVEVSAVTSSSTSSVSFVDVVVRTWSIVYRTSLSVVPLTRKSWPAAKFVLRIHDPPSVRR